MTCGIYKIENKLNGKVYIGQSIQIEARWKQHIHEGKILRTKCPLYLELNQFGENNFSFEILEECEKEKLNEREKYWINFYNSFNDGIMELLAAKGKALNFFIQKKFSLNFGMEEKQ